MYKMILLSLILPPAALSAEAFTIKDGLVAVCDATSGAFNMAAYAKAIEAKSFQHPTVVRYEQLAQDCQANSQAWAQRGNCIVEALLGIDLKDPKQIAALGVVGAVTAVAAAKLISVGIDVGVNYLLTRSKQ